VIAPSQALAALPGAQRGDRPFAVCLAPLQPMAASGLLQGLGPAAQTRSAAKCHLRVFRRAAARTEAHGEDEDAAAGGGPAPLPHSLVEVAVLAPGGGNGPAPAAAVKGAVPLPPGPRAARQAKRKANHAASSASAASSAAAPPAPPAAPALAGSAPAASAALAQAAKEAAKEAKRAEAYEYVSLAALQAEAAKMVKQRFACWAVVLRARRLAPCKAGHDHFMTVQSLKIETLVYTRLRLHSPSRPTPPRRGARAEPPL